MGQKYDFKITFDSATQKYQYLVMNITLDLWLLHILVPIYCVGEKNYFLSSWLKKLVAYFGEEAENFAINVYTRVCIYIVRILTSGFIRDPLPLHFIQEV